ncbi:hypothetical protein CASFOL_030850 [Castilleja foliolosa]|uniref:Uncharacterized protein n=1 Tax=Castilleja foliolosa TaxID=1961234 RepID=A0ABD3C7T5_9LAMI
MSGVKVRVIRIYQIPAHKADNVGSWEMVLHDETSITASSCPLRARARSLRSVRARNESEKPKIGKLQKPIDRNRWAQAIDSNRCIFRGCSKRESISSELSIPIDLHRWKNREDPGQGIDGTKPSIPIDSHRFATGFQIQAQKKPNSVFDEIKTPKTQTNERDIRIQFHAAEIRVLIPSIIPEPDKLQIDIPLED